MIYKLCFVPLQEILIMEIGVFNSLVIDRETSIGLYLTDDKNDVLLPNKYVPNDYEIGNRIEVFVYLDQEHRPVATTLEPYIKRNEFAWLRVNHVNKFGAFLDWGLEKDIFVPFKEQARPMQEGKRYMVHLYLDEKSQRLVASSRISKYLDNQNITVTVGEEVDVLISHITDLGINVIINQKHQGLAYNDEVYKDLKPGQKHIAFIKTIRPDGKIDVSFQKLGFEAIDDNAATIIKELKANKGFLRLNDNSHPEDIKTVLKMSKKSFKKAIGSLYKDKIITIKDDGVYLN